MYVYNIAISLLPTNMYILTVILKYKATIWLKNFETHFCDFHRKLKKSTELQNVFKKFKRDDIQLNS